MSSRRYIKRVWRVPKDRGASAYLAALVVKALVKHGWPATAQVWPFDDGFQIRHFYAGLDASEDFWQAVSIACRIMARTHRIDITEHLGAVTFDRPCTVTSAGFFKEK